jgi:hypothetical protein
MLLCINNVIISLMDNPAKNLKQYLSEVPGLKAVVEPMTVGVGQVQNFL